MESEKVKDIKKALECMSGVCKDATTEICWNCEVCKKFNDETACKEALTLINELEETNERLNRLREVDYKTMTTLRQADTELNECMDEMQDRITELEKKNKILEGTKDRLTFADRIELVNNAVETKLKQFAERLKEKGAYSFIFGKKFIVEKNIDETLKEFLE